MSKSSAAASGRRLSVTEVLDLRFLPDEGLAFDEPLDATWLDAQLQGANGGATVFHASAGSPGTAKLEVEPLAPVASKPPIRIHGSITARVETTCVRCLEPVQQALEAQVDLTLFARADVSPRGPAERDEGLGLTQHELDEGTYEKNEIDLPSLVREALLLEIAMNPACEDEDACSSRTSAMLEAANRPASVVIDDRWAALRRMAEAAGKPPKDDN
jgi:DUF177 domain-containing protein